jgi:hypothetical protein
MFWKFIRWGGTVAVLLLVLAVAFVSTQHEQAATPVQPAAAEQQTNKNFNF